MSAISKAKWFPGAQPVLVAGGGIGGLAAALALGRKGVPVHVLEQATTFGEIGAGIQLGPNVFQMFDVLGVTAAINDVAVFPDALVMRDGVTGDEVTRIPLGTAFRERFGNPYAVIHRGDLHQVLLDACRQMPNITLSVKQKVTGFSGNGDGVIAELADGGRIAGCALIGADGLWSAVRAQLVGDGKPRVSGHIAYRAVLPIAAVPENCSVIDLSCASAHCSALRPHRRFPAKAQGGNAVHQLPQRRINPGRIAFDTEFDPPPAVGEHVREAEQLKFRKSGDDLVHQ